LIKKIVILGPAHPYRGGIALFNERLAQEFQNESVEVNIQTFTLQYPGFLFPGKTQYAENNAPENLKIERSLNSVNPLNWLKVAKKIKKIQPDILLIRYWLPFMSPCLGTVARIVRKNQNIKVISLVDNIIPHEKRPGDRIFSSYFVKSVEGFVVMSKSVLSNLKTFDHNKPKLFSPHPLYDNFGQKTDKNTAIANLNLNPKYKYVLFFGLIRDYKGLDLLIEAFADERFNKLGVKLIVAGEFYSDEEKYKAIIDKYNINNSIIIHNRFVPDNEVTYYFGAADIIAQPYKSATQSGVTQIGYHFEKPMLVTNVGGLSEIIPNGKAGYVVDVNSKDIAGKLIDFFENNRQNDFIENIKKEKKKYEWNSMTNTIRKLYSMI
jgi:glycosyltransferase involved in cell wall biosynthesis